MNPLLFMAKLTTCYSLEQFPFFCCGVRMRRSDTAFVPLLLRALFCSRLSGLLLRLPFHLSSRSLLMLSPLQVIDTRPRSAGCSGAGRSALSSSAFDC